jgi:hypothetical protein
VFGCAGASTITLPPPRFTDFISVGVAGPARAHQGAVGDGGRCGKLVRAHFKGDFGGSEHGDASEYSIELAVFAQ